MTRNITFPKKIGGIAVLTIFFTLLAGCAANSQPAYKDITYQNVSYNDLQSKHTGENGLAKSVSLGACVETEYGFVYWKYNQNSFENSALFAEYANQSTALHQLVLYQNEHEHLLVETNGFGDLCNLGKQIFYFDGKGFQVYDLTSKQNKTIMPREGVDSQTSKILAANDSFLVVMLNQQEYTFDVKEKKVYALPRDFHYIAHDGQDLYGETIAENSYQYDNQLGIVSLWKVSAQGKELKRVLTTEKIYNTPLINGSTNIMDVQFSKDYIYISYGGVDGTAHLYQGGRIIRCDKDGGNVITLVGDDAQQHFTLTDAYLIACDARGTVVYSFQENKCVETNYHYHPIGEPVLLEDQYLYYNSLEETPRILIEKKDYAHFASALIQGEEDACQIQNISVLGNKVFFGVEYSKRNPSMDIGWRYGYSRIKTEYYLKDIDTGQKTLLYCY